MGRLYRAVGCARSVFVYGGCCVYVYAMGGNTVVLYAKDSLFATSPVIVGFVVGVVSGEEFRASRATHQGGFSASLPRSIAGGPKMFRVFLRRIGVWYGTVGLCW